ncbi:MAG: NADAR family protein [Patescibacteria group bacterium]
MTKQETIRIYGRKQPYFQFSNFSPNPFMLLGERWRTSEHLYQALKHVMTDRARALRIRDAKTSRQARDLAWEFDLSSHADWDLVRDDAMRLAVLCKFLGNPELEELLLKTGDCRLIEASPNDYYWGEGDDSSGLNKMGRILMEVRDLLRRPGAAHAKLMLLIGQFRQHLQRLQ